MCVWEGQDGFVIDIRQVGIARHEDGRTALASLTELSRCPTELRGCSGGGLTRRAGPSRVTTYTST